MFGTVSDILYLIDPYIFWTQMALLVGLLLLAIFFPTIKRRFAPRDHVIASIVGIFPQVDDAARGVRRLRENGFPGDRLTVLSSIPYPEGAFGTDTGRSWIRPFALLGGFLGALTGVSLQVWSFVATGLITGGKPLISIPTILVIAYEFTVLSVMLFALGRFLFEARLPRTSGRLDDPRISQGMIGVIARCETDEQVRQAEETISSLGASETRRVEGRLS